MRRAGYRLALRRPQNSPEAGEIERLNPMSITARDGRRHGEGIEDGFFRGLDRGGDEWIDMTVGQVREGVGGFFWIVWNHIRGGKGQHEISAAVPRRGAGAGQAERGSLCESRKLPAVEWGICGDDNDNGTFALAGRERLRLLLRQ